MNTKNKNILIGVAVILILSFLLYLFMLNNQLNQSEEQKKIAATGNDSILSSEVLLSYNENKTFIAEAIGNRISIVIYRYEKGMCGGCIQSDLDELKKFQLQAGTDRVLILPVFINDRNNRIAVKSDLVGFEFCYVPKENLILPVDSENYARRYFAYINRQGDIERIYFIDSEQEKSIATYLLKIQQMIEDE
jgi:hypothetical protein